MAKYKRIVAGMALLALGACATDDLGSPQPGSTISDGTAFADAGDVGASDGLDATAPPADFVASDADAGAEASLCEPYAVVCATPFATKQCAPTGHSWFETACPEVHGCVEGECVPQTCTPGASSGVCIDDDTYERCNDPGTAIETVHCGAGAYCYLGACIPQLCTPGTVICKSFGQLQVCSGDGTAWLDGEMCQLGSKCFDGACLSPCEVNIKDGSYIGCEYWAMDLDNIEDAQYQDVGVVVSVPLNTSPTDVTITSTATGLALSAAELGATDTHVAAGQTKVFKLPLGFDIDGTMLTNRSFRIETSSPVIVHQFNPLNGEGVHTNDASLLLPSTVTGRTYLVMAWPHRADNATLRGFATVVATQAGMTAVKVVPSADVAASDDGAVGQLQAGTPYLFVLSQGQVLNLETDGQQGADLTGTLIEADKKVSVIGGHECANVPLGISACDHLESQLFPVETWSSEYVADTFEPRSPSQLDVWRVMAGDNDVTVTTNPPVPGYETFQLQRGGWVQFATAESFVVTADGKIMVGHYLTGSSYPGAKIVCTNTGIGKDTAIGDPAFTLAAPVKRYLKQYAVLTPSGYAEDYLNIVAPQGTTVSIDGVPVAAPFQEIAGTGYAIARATVAPGVHLVSGSKAFGLTAYGYACDVSYAYPGGLKLQAFGGSTP